MARSLLAAAVALVTAAAIAPGAPAHAQTVTFSGAGSFADPVSLPIGSAIPPGLTAGAYTFSFVVPQSPTPTTTVSNGFTLDGVTASFVQGATHVDVLGTLWTFDASSSGGFNFTGTGLGVILNTFSPTIFMGPTTAPTFVPGSYTPSASGGEGDIRSFTIAATTTTAPEPTTTALLAGGLVLVGGAAARRRRTT